MGLLLAILVNLAGLGSMAWSAVLVWRGQHAMEFHLGRMLEEARRQNQQLFDTQLAPRTGGFTVSPNSRIRLAKYVDVSAFGPECVRLQLLARAAYHRALRGVLPFLGYGVVMSVATALGLFRR